MERNTKFPLRIDQRTVIYVTKEKLTPEYAEMKRKQFNSISTQEQKGGNTGRSLDIDKVRSLVQNGMHLKDIAKKIGVSKTTIENYIRKYDLRNNKQEGGFKDDK